MAATSLSLCLDTVCLAHRDAIGGEQHPPHLHFMIREDYTGSAV